jgi:hypothetical protein
LYKPNMPALSSAFTAIIAYVRATGGVAWHAMTAVASRRCACIISNADIGFARLTLICISSIDWIALGRHYCYL